MIVKKGIWLWAVILFVMPLCVSAGEYNAGVRGKVILHTDKMSNGEPIDYLDKDHPKVTVDVKVEIAPQRDRLAQSSDGGLCLRIVRTADC